MSKVEYDLDTSGGLMDQIQALIAPPSSNDDKKDRSKKPEHPYFRKPGKGHNHDSCDACSEGGDLICCDKCPSSFHLLCYDPPLEEKDIPMGEWLCHTCQRNAAQAAATKVSNSCVPRTRSKRVLSNPETSQTSKLPPKKSKGNPLDVLVEAALALNPKQFELPRSMSMPCIFPGTDKERPYLNTNRRNFKLFRNKQTITPQGLSNPPMSAKCFECRRCCRIAPLLACDYCPLFYHLDCLDPPLSTPPSGKWMCPNHVEHALDSKLLTSISATERIKLWDKFTGPVDQDVIKLEFFRKVHRKNPPFRFKIKLSPRNHVTVPPMVKYHYKYPVELLPSLRDVLRYETIMSRPQIFHSDCLVIDGTDKTEEKVPDEPIREIEGNSPSLPPAQLPETAVADIVEVKQENEDVKQETEEVGREEEEEKSHKPNGIFEMSCEGEKMLGSGSCNKCDNQKYSTNTTTTPLDADATEIKVEIDSSSADNAVVDMELCDSITNDSALCVTEQESHALDEDTSKVNNTKGRSKMKRGRKGKNQEVKRKKKSPNSSMKNNMDLEDNLLSNGLEGDKNDVTCIKKRETSPVTATTNINDDVEHQLNQLDDRLLKLLAYQRIHEILTHSDQSNSTYFMSLLSNKLFNMPMPSELLTSDDIERIARIFASPSRKPCTTNKPKSNLRARAMLCPVISKHFYNMRTSAVDPTELRHDGSYLGYRPTVSARFPEAAAMRYRVLNIGKGAANDLQLEHFGHCNFISPKHAVIFHDEVTQQYEILNYSCYGIYINNVLYTNNETKHLKKEDRKVEASCLEAQVREIVDKKRKISRTKKNSMDVKMTAIDCVNSMECSCVPSTYETLNEGWEGSTAIHHGSVLRFGCISFVFSIIECANI